MNTSTPTDAIQMGPRHALITVMTGEFRQGQELFLGTWIVDPDDDVRSTGGGSRGGLRYGIADTKHGNVAVYRYHVEDRTPAVLTVYDNIDDAEEQGLPPNLAAEYRVVSGEAVFRDI